jgi:hypothetical protein
MLAERVTEMLDEFYASFTKKAREPRGTLLILDRSFDLVAPIQHDYFY